MTVHPARLAAAALLASALSACAPDAGENCSELLVRVNQLLFDTTADDRYATMFYAVYDPGTRRLSWTNAGHCPPWLLHGSASSRLDSLTCPVGLTPAIPAAHGTVSLTPGDRLLIVSDGITEARTAADEQFGDDRCGQQALAHPRGGSARHLCAALLEQVGAFSGGLREDDQTVVAFLLTES